MKVKELLDELLDIGSWNLKAHKRAVIIRKEILSHIGHVAEDCQTNKSDITEITARARKHKHRCMRCGEEFDCQSIGICGANYNVMANIVKPDGTIVEHCPCNPDWDWIRAYGKRLAAQSAPVEEVAREIDKYYQVFEETPEHTRISEVTAILRQHGYGAQGQGPKPKQKPSWGFSGYLEVLPEEEPSPVPSPESATKEGNEHSQRNFS
jgi:hypothetical protein